MSLETLKHWEVDDIVKLRYSWKEPLLFLKDLASIFACVTKYKIVKINLEDDIVLVYDKDYNRRHYEFECKELFNLTVLDRLEDEDLKEKWEISN